jgi:hypothetical protein
MIKVFPFIYQSKKHRLFLIFVWLYLLLETHITLNKTVKLNLFTKVLACILFIGMIILFFQTGLSAQDKLELRNGWKYKNASEVSVDGTKISEAVFELSEWPEAIIPGTVLTNLLASEKIPDPFYGMNNNQIPDIYHTGPEYYTYWFVCDFDEYDLEKDEELWLHFRGVNYGCDIFFNGEKLNSKTHKGMFLRQAYRITEMVRKKRGNRVAVIVYPPDHVGNPNGGQGGDGAIGRNVAHQYVAGWDWIQPVRDRNTGIWDKVWIEKTKEVKLQNPHVVTKVPGIRIPGRQQEDAIVLASAEIENPTEKSISGLLKFEISGILTKKEVDIEPHTTKLVSLPELSLPDPELWWPNGYGSQKLYPAEFQFLINEKVSDTEQLSIGVREIKQQWNERTRSTEFLVNGQRIFIKGGNWIISDAMLRFSPERYDAEIRFHRDMNLNMIRIWGGAITERPEFYEACDKYGLLVMQDFWMSGDCNGRWLDPKKLDDQWTRRQYPDDHHLFIESAGDMIKMIRNHASLAVWCGGNEITPPENILIAITDSLMPQLDGTRKFITYSNSDSMSYNFIGGNGDGPYSIQPLERFWEERTFPFNSEVGSVGIGDYESLKRFIPRENLVHPDAQTGVDSVWRYHKYIGYADHIEKYGTPHDVREFAEIAQMVNYDQYRALSEGFTSHMWDWYTGYIIWKTQNPWTALRGQMYDYYLDPNASLYGLHHGNETIHVMCNPVNGMVSVTNHSFESVRDMMLKVEAYDMEGKKTLVTQVFVYMKPTSTKKIMSVENVKKKIGSDKGCFIRLQLIKNREEVLSDNFYWYPNAEGEYTGLQSYEQPQIKVQATNYGNGKIAVTINNPEGGKVSFFNRISLVDVQSGQRLLPVFYSDNYVSITPGEAKTIIIDNAPITHKSFHLSLKAWNAKEQIFPLED